MHQVIRLPMVAMYVSLALGSYLLFVCLFVFPLPPSSLLWVEIFLARSESFQWWCERLPFFGKLEITGATFPRLAAFPTSSVTWGTSLSQPCLHGCDQEGEMGSLALSGTCEQSVTGPCCQCLQSGEEVPEAEGCWSRLQGLHHTWLPQATVEWMTAGWMRGLLNKPTPWPAEGIVLLRREQPTFPWLSSTFSMHLAASCP